MHWLERNACDKWDPSTKQELYREERFWYFVIYRHDSKWLYSTIDWLSQAKAHIYFSVIICHRRYLINQFIIDTGNKRLKWPSVNLPLKEKWLRMDAFSFTLDIIPIVETIFFSIRYLYGNWTEDLSRSPCAARIHFLTAWTGKWWLIKWVFGL